MKEYYNLLGLKLSEVEEILSQQNLKYNVEFISGKKDKEKLTIPRVIKISKTKDTIEVIATYFSDSLK